MYACKLLARSRPGAVVLAVRHVPDGVEDDLLRKSDRHPNARGAELLGLPVVDFTGPGPAGGSRPAIASPPDGAVLLAVGFDCLIGERLDKFFDKFSQICMISARESILTGKAHVLIPGLTVAEKEGLIVNFEGHIQKLLPALDGLWDKTPPWQVIARLVAELTGERRLDTIAGMRSQLGWDEGAFSGLDLNAIGATGVRLERRPV
jgi:NADH dehydrogenase/NADH:ubiquinone oxidoreductase subunit G